jgi:lipoate-protein ligase A
VVQALSSGFSQALNLILIAGHPTPQEVRRAAELIRTRYANAEWTARH